MLEIAGTFKPTTLEKASLETMIEVHRWLSVTHKPNITLTPTIGNPTRFSGSLMAKSFVHFKVQVLRTAIISILRHLQDFIWVSGTQVTPTVLLVSPSGLEVNST